MSQIIPLKITEQEGDTIEIYLDPVKQPTTYQRKLHELISSGMTQDQAEAFIRTTPFVLELFYSMDQGLFAVESEALESCEIYNPYSGQEIPNDNLPERPVDNLKKIDDITCQLSNINDELQYLHAWDKLTPEGEEVIENAKSHLEDCLTEIHKFTDPDDKAGLIEEELT